MTEKGLSDTDRRSAELRYEWQSFLGLLPVLDLRLIDPVLYQRCLTAVWLSRKSAIGRTDLQQAEGLGFQAEAVDFDLLVARLVREGILEPIVSSPFHFQIRRRNWTNPESAYAADDRLSLSAISREEQTARFRMLGLLDARILNPRLPGKRVQQIRKERDELAGIYEATWLELENAIGRKAAEAIRKSVEETTEAGAFQLDLPLEKKRHFDLEGEARCNQ
ncbi:MAG TPA: hypothetical protein VNH83_26795 [Bryobacteraceae bacterium]|nr:hypothetical protein [Bryobacteraceae bacterium]